MIDKALDSLAIPTIRQVLTTPTNLDKLRLDIGQAAIEANRDIPVP